MPDASGPTRDTCRVATVVLIEDDAAIRTALTGGLTRRGHQVEAAASGLEGLRVITGSRPEAVVLDLGLPDISGIDLLRMLRAVSDVPVLVVTAHDDEPEIIRTLDAGADDYVVKPASAEQIDARLRALMRRARPDERVGPVVVGDLVLDATTREATLLGRPLELSRKEFDLALYLASRPGEVVTKRELLAEVWQQPYGGADKTVDVHLSWLRRKLGEKASEPGYLRTVRGVGVKLVDPASD